MEGTIDGRCMSCGATCNTAGCPNDKCPSKRPQAASKDYVLSLMELLTIEERLEIIGQFCPEHGCRDCSCGYIGH